MKKIGFFPGVFDLLHLGHIRALREAKRQCDELVVGVKLNTNDQPEKNEPIMSTDDRLEALMSLVWVDRWYLYKSEKELHDEDRDSSLGQTVRFMGEDHKPPHHPIKAKVIYISRDHDWSSSNLRKRICKTS